MTIIFGILVTTIASSFRLSTPLFLGSLGELVCEKSGMLNLSIEGSMTLGAFTGFCANYVFGINILGFFFSILAGALIGFILGVLIIKMGLNQHVCGIGMTIILKGLSDFFYRVYFGVNPVPPAIVGIDPIKVFITNHDNPNNPYIFSVHLFTIVLILTFPFLIFLIEKTKLRLILTAVGDSPKSADVCGISIKRVRFLSIIFSNIMASLAGCFIVTALYNKYAYDLISGRGWICIAIVFAGNWKIKRCILFAFIFALMEAIGLKLLTTSTSFAYQICLCLPYIMTILILIFFFRGNKEPLELMKPYFRE